MTRYEFLKSMGFKGAALMAVMTSCIREEDTYIDALKITPTASTSGTTTPPVATVPPNTTDLSTIKNPLLTIDLTASTNASLKTVGGYLSKSGIVVAQTSAGTFIAVTQTCSHEPKKQVIFNKTEFYCTAHGARFNLSGQGMNSLGSRGIAVYKVATDGKTLVVYS